MKGHLRHCTHALTFDDRDAETLAEELNIPTMWCPPVVTWREVCDSVDLPEPGPAAFQGTIYNLERKAAARIRHWRGVADPAALA